MGGLDRRKAPTPPRSPPDPYRRPRLTMERTRGLVGIGGEVDGWRGPCADPGEEVSSAEPIRYLNGIYRKGRDGVNPISANLRRRIAVGTRRPQGSRGSKSLVYTSTRCAWKDV